MPKRTFQPNRRHRSKTHGFRTRMKTKSGAAVLSRRRAKGRHKIAVSAGFPRLVFSRSGELTFVGSLGTEQLQVPPLRFAPIKMTNQIAPDITRHGAWRLRKHAEYQLVYKSSRKQQSSTIAFFATSRSTLPSHGMVWTSARVGLTAGRVLGNAVERNRIKRRMREAVKASVHLLPAQADVILHPRRQVLTVEFPILKAEVEKIFSLVANRMGAVPNERLSTTR